MFKIIFLIFSSKTSTNDESLQVLAESLPSLMYMNHLEIDLKYLICFPFKMHFLNFLTCFFQSNSALTSPCMNILLNGIGNCLKLEVLKLDLR